MIQQRNPDGRRRQEPADRLWPFDAADASPVCSYNEWDPLEEVIVGVMDGASVPAWDTAVAATMPARSEGFFPRDARGPLPPGVTSPAPQGLGAFAPLSAQAAVRVGRA